jgi:meiotically up-regulated gene 157 (Mug157) protein
MTDPVIVVTSAKILDLAFNEFIKSSAGEAAKKMTDEAFTKVNELRQKILSWFQNKKHNKAVNAISEIQSTKSVASFNKLATYLSDEMDDSPDFAKELQQIVQQIINIEKITQVQTQESTSNYNFSDNAKMTQVNADHVGHVGDNYAH